MTDKIRDNDQFALLRWAKEGDAEASREIAHRMAAKGVKLLRANSANFAVVVRDGRHELVTVPTCSILDLDAVPEAEAITDTEINGMISLLNGDLDDVPGVKVPIVDRARVYAIPAGCPTDAELEADMPTPYADLAVASIHRHADRDDCDGVAAGCECRWCAEDRDGRRWAHRVRRLDRTGC